MKKSDTFHYLLIVLTMGLLLYCVGHLCLPYHASLHHYTQ